jgi:very-short-patch-repair endonuclease
MRLAPTPAETILWGHLRKSQTGFKFRRQQLLFGFIADFWCAELGLIVEADGPVHDKDRDAHRDREMAKYGISTLRIFNHELSQDIVACVAEIVATCERIKNQMLNQRSTSVAAS